MTQELTYCREHILKIGYSERFWRKYQFYFAYCEAAFDARYIHDYHLVWRKGEANSQVEAQVTCPLMRVRTVFSPLGLQLWSLRVIVSQGKEMALHPTTPFN